MVDAVMPGNVSNYMREQASGDMSIAAQRIKLIGLQQGFMDEQGMRNDLAQMDQKMDILDKLSRASELALAHNQPEMALKFSQVLSGIAYKQEIVNQRNSAARKAEEEAIAKRQETFYKSIGIPGSESEWNTMRLIKQSSGEPLDREQQAILNLPFKEAKEFLSTRGITPEKRKAMDLEEARIAAEKALEAERLARERQIKLLTAPKVAAERARANAANTLAQVHEAQAEKTREGNDARRKNGGAGAVKLSEATSGDKKDVAGILKNKYPGLESNAGAVGTIAQEAKERQRREGGDYATAVKKVIAEKPGRFLKKEGGKSMFKDIPPGIPPDAQYMGDAEGKSWWKDSKGTVHWSKD